MTQEIINKYFSSELGEQLNNLYSAPDDKVFIRYKEALDHCINNNLNKGDIIEWYPE